MTYSSLRSGGTAVVIATLLASAPAYAGDCLNVKPQIKNFSRKEIKVTDITYRRNGETYFESVTNRKIQSGRKYKFSGQRLNHLDSGQRAVFGVVFKIRLDANDEWVSRSARKANDEGCWDGKTINIKVHNYDFE